MNADDVNLFIEKILSSKTDLRRKNSLINKKNYLIYKIKYIKYNDDDDLFI